MRAVIVGQKWLAIQLLELCLARGIEIAKVFVPDPGPSGRPDSLEEHAKAESIPFARASRVIPPELIPRCDVILAAHAHAFIGPAAREKARLGALGYHPSLLPRHRGRDAIRWALHMKEAITGGSLYWMDDGADTGPVVAQVWCHIRPDDTPATLWRRELAPIGISLFDNTLRRLVAGDPCVGRPQDPVLATWEPAWKAGHLAQQ